MFGSFGEGFIEVDEELVQLPPIQEIKDTFGGYLNREGIGLFLFRSGIGRKLLRLCGPVYVLCTVYPLLRMQQAYKDGAIDPETLTASTKIAREKWFSSVKNLLPAAASSS